ncbi:MAG: hypothetical protein LBC96_04845 [Lachnospiraceae bacterium]|jgi:hypothetical protein|nr:hypothetical protein [Lachnospiraceae bacterium]
MSTEWYLQAHSSGGEQFIPPNAIQSVLSDYQSKTEEKCVVVTLPEGDVDFYVDLSIEVSNLIIARPIESAALYRIIYEIMQCGRFVFFAPEAKFPIILSYETVDHLPESMLKALSKPQIADSLETFSGLLKEMYA